MPTNLGALQHVGHDGDRTTPLPATTWAPPRPKTSSIDWAAIRAAQPAPVVEPTPPAARVRPSRSKIGARRKPGPKPAAPRHTCADCGGRRSHTSATRCQPCYFKHLAANTLTYTCTDCAEPIAPSSVRCVACSRRHVAATIAARISALGTTPAKLRAWGIANGHGVGRRGRIPISVIDAYEQTHA